jgi:hypothetical protein
MELSGMMEVTNIFFITVQFKLKDQKFCTKDNAYILTVLKMIKKCSRQLLC